MVIWIAAISVPAALWFSGISMLVDYGLGVTWPMLCLAMVLSVGMPVAAKIIMNSDRSI